MSMLVFFHLSCRPIWAGTAIILLMSKKVNHHFKPSLNLSKNQNDHSLKQIQSYCGPRSSFYLTNKFFVHVHVYVCVFASRTFSLNLYMLVHCCVYIHMYIFSFIRACTNVHTNVNVSMCICACTSTHVHWPPSQPWEQLTTRWCLRGRFSFSQKRVIPIVTVGIGHWQLILNFLEYLGVTCTTYIVPWWHRYSVYLVAGEPAFSQHLGINTLESALPAVLSLLNQCRLTGTPTRIGWICCRVTTTGYSFIPHVIILLLSTKVYWYRW